MITQYYEGMADMYAEEGKVLLRASDGLAAKHVSTPRGEEANWSEIDAPANIDNQMEEKL